MAQLDVHCPNCGKSFRLKDRSMLGRRARCDQCETHFVLEVADNGSTSHDQANVPPAEQLQSSSSAQGASMLRDFRRRDRQRRKSAVVMFTAFGLAVALVFVLTRATRPVSQNEVAEVPPNRVAANVAGANRPASQPSDADDSSGVTSQTTAATNEPTSGKPISLIGIPGGASIIVHLRPAELWQEDPAAKELRTCLEPLTGWAETHLKELCLLDAAAIESAVVGLVLHPDGQPPDCFAVVRLVEGQSSQQLVENLNLQRVDSFERQVFENARSTVIIKDTKNFTVGPYGRAQEMIDAAEFQQPTLASIEQLLEQTDESRVLTVLFDLADVRRQRELLFPENLRDFVGTILDWFGPDVESLAFCSQPGETFSVDFALRSGRGTTPAKLARTVRRNLDELPQKILAAVQQMKPQRRGERRVIGRFPAMLEAVSLSTESEVARRVVRLNANLPERAGPNLALAACLTWKESARTLPGKSRPTESTPVREMLID